MRFSPRPCLLAVALVASGASAFGQAAAPSWLVGYVFSSDNNYVPLAPGGQIQFPATSTDATVTVSILVSNAGSGAGNLKSVSVSGANFQPTGLPIFPVTLASGKQVSFGIVYSPVKSGDQTGTLELDFSDGTTFRLQLIGSVASPAMKVTYYFQGVGNVFTVDTGGAIVFPATPVSNTATAVIGIANFGAGAGNVTSVAVTGDDFKLLGVGLLPVVVGAGKALQFSIAYTPSAPGTSTGTLTVAVDSATLVVGLTGTSTGPLYAYGTLNGADLTSLAAGQSVPFPETALGQTSATTLQVTNAGNATGTISNIAVNGAGFQLSSVPILPVTLAPNAAVQFNVSFTPSKSGPATGYLEIGSASFSLAGSAIAIPSIQIVGPTQPVAALQQPSIGLTLASPYPAPLSGTLTLAVTSDTSTIDPAVQFATGGRTVAFTIPANSTTAQFPGGSTISLQSGTVAGTISLSATLETKSGADVTPDIPPSLSFQVPAATPQVLDISVASETATGFTLVVTGLSTARSLTQLALDFVPSASYNVSAGHFTFDIQSAAAVWYQSQTSQNYGSLFTATVPFTFQSSSSSLTPGQVFQSISATLTNSIGQSNKLSVTP